MTGKRSRCFPYSRPACLYCGSRYFTSLFGRQFLGSCHAPFVLDRFETQLTKELEGISDEMSSMKRRKEELDAQIANLVAAVADGTKSPALMGEITKRERELSEISDRLLFV